MASKLYLGETHSELVRKFNELVDENKGFEIVELTGDSGTLTEEEYGKLTSGSAIIKLKSSSSTGIYQYYMPFGFNSHQYTFAKMYISDTECILNLIEIDQINKSWVCKSTTYNCGGITSDEVANMINTAINGALEGNY